PSRSQPRSVGKSPTASVDVSTSSHRSSGVRTPPGKRQPIPTTATGSREDSFRRRFSFLRRWTSFTESRSALTTLSLLSVSVMRASGSVVVDHTYEVVDVHAVNLPLVVAALGFGVGCGVGPGGPGRVPSGSDLPAQVDGHGPGRGVVQEYGAGQFQ